MKSINLFFFGDEEISLHDTLWLYVGYSVILTISSIGFIAAQF